MVSGTRQILGFATAVIGFLGSIITCALPAWKVKNFNGGCFTPPIEFWEGLWMNCHTLFTSLRQCRVYASSSKLSQDLQAARVLVVIAIILGVVGILLAIVGGKCTNCVKNERQKCQANIAAGVIFIITGLLVLIPVCWVAIAITIAHDFYDHALNDFTFKLGASLYVGWAAAGLLFLGGGLLCTNEKIRNLTENLRFSRLKNQCEV